MIDVKAELNKIGLNIMYFRKQKGLTQLELADLSDYSRNHIQQIETGKVSPSIETLLIIADVLDIPVAKLFEEK